MHITGTTVTGDESKAWGAQVGAHVRGQGRLRRLEIRRNRVQSARGNGSTQVRFNIGDINTHLDGKICETCWNHFGKTLSLTPEWKEYRILFTDTRQEDGWGNPRPAAITPSKLYNLEFKIGPGQTYRHLGRRRRVSVLPLVECRQLPACLGATSDRYSQIF